MSIWLICLSMCVVLGIHGGMQYTNMICIAYFGQGLLEAIRAIRISTSQYTVGLGDECHRRNVQILHVAVETGL